MTFQLISTMFLTYANAYVLKDKKKDSLIAADSNVYITANFVGVIVGLLGLSGTGLNFFFPRSLGMVKYHQLISSIVLLIPYAGIVIYWLYIKMREKPKRWYDEKQLRDIGISSCVTLALGVLVMGIVYFFHFDQLYGMVSVLWFPFFVFLVLFLFSTINIYNSRN